MLSWIANKRNRNNTNSCLSAWSQECLCCIYPIHLLFGAIIICWIEVFVDWVELLGVLWFEGYSKYLNCLQHHIAIKSINNIEGWLLYTYRANGHKCLIGPISTRMFTPLRAVYNTWNEKTKQVPWVFHRQSVAPLDEIFSSSTTILSGLDAYNNKLPEIHGVHNTYVSSPRKLLRSQG